MAYVPNSNSVVAFQQNPSSLLVGASIMGLTPVAVTNSPSISGTVNVGNFPTTQNVSGSVAAVIIGGSVATATTNSSVQLLNSANTIGSVAAIVSNFPTTQNVSGSVVTTQSGTVISSLVNTIPSSVQVGASIMGHAPVVIVGGSIAASFTPPANQSVSGQVDAFIVGGSIATATTNSSIMLLNGDGVIGSVTTLQGTNPWRTLGSVSGTVLVGGTTQVMGTIASGNANGDNPIKIAGVYNSTQSSVNSGSILEAQFTSHGAMYVATGVDPFIASVSGSIGITGNPSISGTVNIGIIPGSTLAFQAGTQITSLVSTVPSSVIVGSSIFGQLPAGTATLGSVIAYQGAASWNVGGSVLAQQMGTNISSVVSSTPSSMLTGASIFGQLPAGTAVLGSVTALQGTLPWAIAGSVVATQGTNPWVIGSINGTFAEDAAHASGDLGNFQLAVRNDTVASLTSASGDYSGIAVDAPGRTITKPFAGEDSTIISYTGSVVSASVTLIQASAIGKKSYITDFLITNTGSVAQLITFQDGSTSILGYTIAPAGGGSNAIGWNIPMKTANAQDLAFKATGTSSVVYVTVKGYQAQ